MEKKRKKKNNSDCIDLTNLLSITPSLERKRQQNMAEFVDLTSCDFVQPFVRKSIHKDKEKKRSLVPIIDLTEDYKKNNNGNEQFDECSLCTMKVSLETKDEHLKSCEGLQNLFEDSVPIDGVNWKDKGDIKKKCPICALNISGDMKSHVDGCLKNFGIVNIFDDPTMPLNDKDGAIDCSTTKMENSALSNGFDETVLEISDSESPISACGSKIKVPDILTVDKRLPDKAVVTKIAKTNYSCLLCGLHVKGDMSSHLDSCLKNYSVFDEDESVIELCYDESPVKTVGSYSKVPKPIMLNDDDSEERRTCYSCGMRFGLSKIASHYCVK